MGVNIDTELLEFQEEYDTTFLDRTRACINEIIKKNMNLILN